MSTNTEISGTALGSRLNEWEAHSRTSFNIGMKMLAQSKVKTKDMED